MFGDKLKDLRSARGWTQTQLADASGVPVGTIRDLEQNKREPMLSTAQKLAAALGLSLDEFPQAGSEPTSPTPRKAPPADRPARGRKRK